MWEVSTGKAVTLAPFERHMQTAFSLHPHSIAEEVCIVTWGVQAESCLQVTFKGSQCHCLTGLLVCKQCLSLRLPPTRLSACKHTTSSNRWNKGICLCRQSKSPHHIPVKDYPPARDWSLCTYTCIVQAIRLCGNIDHMSSVRSSNNGTVRK